MFQWWGRGEHLPLTEGGSINLNDGTLGQGIGANQLVVGGMESDGNDTGFLADTLRSPREVARIQTKRTELPVTATGADQMDT